MDENTPADTSATSQRPPRSMPEGRPFPRGTSGCPGGRAGVTRRLRAEQTEKLVAHLGRPLLAQEAELVEQLVKAKMAKPVSVSDTLRQAGLIARLTNKLYGIKPEAKPSPLPPMPSTSEMAERYRARGGR